MAKKARNTVSVSKGFYDRLEAEAIRRGVPKSAIVEISLARAMGMPLGDLGASVRKWIPVIFPQGAPSK